MSVSKSTVPFIGLPIEIYWLIFDHCCQSTILELSQTCKYIHECTLPIIYGRIDLSFDRQLSRYLSYRDRDICGGDIDLIDEDVERAYGSLMTTQQDFLETMSSKEEYSKYVKKITWTLLKPLTHSFYENGTFGKVFEKFQTVEFNLDVYGSDQLIDPPPTPPTELCISELSIEARRLPYMPFKSLRRCFRPKRRSPGTLSSSEKTDEIGALDTPGLDKPLGGPLEGFRFKSINHLHLHDVGCLDEFEGRTMVLRNSLLDKLAKPEEERYENWTSFINSHKHSLKSFSFSQKHRRLSMRGQKRLWLFYQSTHAYGGTPDVHVADQCVGYILPLITSGGWDNLETLKLCNVGAGVGRYIGSLFVLYGGLDAAHQEKIRSAVGSGVKVEMS